MRTAPIATPLRTARRVGPRVAAIGGLALALLFASYPVIAAPVSAAEPRVAIIVGPTGSATDAYRAEAESAAAEARLHTSEVVTVYSPDATWPAARAAMQGASIVIYIGHGNGWPSRYSAALSPATQDGLGLNPVAGVDDDAHQYFGEAYLASSVHLAPHAVVLLFHLCYASGESEPGLPAASLDEAEQRVDNYAAGWMRAGAEAVVASAATDAGPYYVGAILSSAGSMESIWRGSPTFRDHVIAFPSARTPGMAGLLDPTDPETGFYSSLVGRATLRASEVARGAAVMANEAGYPPGAGPGPTVTGVSFDGVPVAGSTIRLVAASPTLVAGPVEFGIRWDLLQIDPTSPPPAPAAEPGGPPGAIANATTGAIANATTGAGRIPASGAILGATTGVRIPTGAPAAAGGRSLRGSPAPSAGPDPAPGVSPVELVRPEVLGEVVSIVEARSTAAGLDAAIRVPDEPGLYRVVITLHDGDGVAFDRGTQAQLPALIARVTRTVSATIAAPPSLVMVAGVAIDLPLAVTNSGQDPWTEVNTADSAGASPATSAPPSALVVGHWLALDAASGLDAPPGAQAAVTVLPGASATVTLRVTAPSATGAYLLVIDVVSPLHGSLTAQGMTPVAIPVRVDPLSPASPDAAPRDHR